MWSHLAWWGVGVCWSVGCAPSLHYVTWQLPYNLGKIMEKLQREQESIQKLFSWSVPSMISRLDHPAVTLTGLLNIATLGFHVRWRGSTLSQHRCLQSYQTRGFLTSANFESKLAVRALMWSKKSGTPRSSRFCLPQM